MENEDIDSRLEEHRRHFRAKPAWTRDDMPRLDWVFLYAATGHPGAQALLDDLLEPDRVNDLIKLSPERVFVMAASVPKAAALLALRHAGQSPPDLLQLMRWLARSPQPYPAFAVALREVQAAGSFLGESDLKLLKTFLLRHVGALGLKQESAGEPIELLVQLAEERLRPEAPAEVAAGLWLVRRAAVLGSEDARALAASLPDEAAPEQLEFCQRLAAAFDTRSAALSLAWHARAVELGDTDAGASLKRVRRYKESDGDPAPFAAFAARAFALAEQGFAASDVVSAVKWLNAAAALEHKAAKAKLASL